MPAYDRSSATAIREIDHWGGGVGWIAHPHEDGERASHALATDDGVWVLDPVDGPEVDELLTALGDVRGVAVLSSYHARDAGAVAARHDVSVHVPAWMERVPERVDAPIEREDEVLGEAGFETIHLEPISLYQEAVLYREADGTLIVPDVCSSGSGYPAPGERVGVMLGSRLFPPREAFEGVEPERILFGHGEGIFEDADEALEDALDGARRRFPRAFVRQFGTNLRLFLSSMLD